MFIKFFKYCYLNQQMFIQVIMIQGFFLEDEKLLGRALFLGEIQYVSLHRKDKTIRIKEGRKYTTLIVSFGRSKLNMA